MRLNRFGRAMLVSTVVASIVAGGGTPAVAATPASAGPALTHETVPTPTVTGPVTGGRVGLPFTSSPVPLGPAGYTEQEYFFDGTATGYQQSGTWGSDGRWSVQPAEQAAYRSRMLVRRPADPARFNGTVVVEWLNVSTGVDVDPDYLYDNAELLRAGYAWVGVSAQQRGVSALRGIDPARYSSLSHPGDTFSYSIFSQAAQSLLTPGGVNPLGGLRPRAVLADGESQSAFRMVTYANAIQPVDRLFDGFLVHSRSSDSAPLSQAPQADQPSPPIAASRTDLASPLLTVQTETDLFGPDLNYYQATQPDSRGFRLWELAGTSHADATVERLGAEEVAPFIPTLPPLGCALPANDGQERYLMDDALSQLNRWVRTRIPATPAARIEVDATPAIVRDQYGNARGGVRTPALQAPTATLSGTGNSGTNFQCALLGTTTPFTAAQLAALYPTRLNYVADVARAAIADTAAGFLLPVDAKEIIAAA